MPNTTDDTTKVSNRCLRLAAESSDKVSVHIKHIKHHDHKVQLLMRANALTLLTAKTLAGLDPPPPPGSAPLAPDETTLSAAYETKLKNQRRGQMLNSSLTTIRYQLHEKILLAAAIADAKKGGGNVKEEAERILGQSVATLSKKYGLNAKDVRKKQNKVLKEVRGMDDDDARLLRAPARDGAAAVGEGSESGAAVGEESELKQLARFTLQNAKSNKEAADATNKAAHAAIKLATSNKETLEEHGRKHEQQDAINKEQTAINEEQTAINEEQGKKIAENCQNLETLGTAVKTLKKMITTEGLSGRCIAFDSDDAETVEATYDDSAVSANDASFIGGDGSIDFEENAAEVCGEASDLYTSPTKATKRSALASSPKTTPGKFIALEASGLYTTPTKAPKRSALASSPKTTPDKSIAETPPTPNKTPVPSPAPKTSPLLGQQPESMPTKTPATSPLLKTAQATTKDNADASHADATKAAPLLGQPVSVPEEPTWGCIFLRFIFFLIFEMFAVLVWNKLR